MEMTKTAFENVLGSILRGLCHGRMEGAKCCDSGLVLVARIQEMKKIPQVFLFIFNNNIIIFLSFCDARSSNLD